LSSLSADTATHDTNLAYYNTDTQCVVIIVIIISCRWYKQS